MMNESTFTDFTRSTMDEHDVTLRGKEVPKMFVAGNNFYNYEMYGGLRPGGKPHFFSRKQFGLTCSVFASAFVYVGVRYGLQPLLTARFGFSDQQLVAADRLVELPATFCFLIGLLADSYPLFGYHRKSYMVLGLLISLVGLGGIGLICWFEDSIQRSLKDGFAYLITAFLGVVSFGSMINFTSVHTMVVVLSQQETLGERGIAQANYLIIRICGQWVAQVLTLIIEELRPSMHVPLTIAMLLFVPLLAIPMIICYLAEGEAYERRPMKQTCDECWKLTQQKAVWRIICFVSCVAFFMGFRFNNVQDALQEWTKVQSTGRLLSYVLHDVLMLLTILVWRTFYMNALWKRVFAVAPIMAIIPQALITSLIVFNVVRAEAFYILGNALGGISQAILALTTLVPVTEIVQEGTEGATVGLILSFDKLFKIFVSTFLSSVQMSAVFSMDEVVHDTDSVRWFVLMLRGIGFLVNALTFAALPFLPLQKLDAQQLRTFGGFARGAAFATATVFVLLFLYCAVLNSLSFFPGTSCLRLVGGPGCR